MSQWRHNGVEITVKVLWNVDVALLCCCDINYGRDVPIVNKSQKYIPFLDINFIYMLWIIMNWLVSVTNAVITDYPYCFCVIYILNHIMKIRVLKLWICLCIYPFSKYYYFCTSVIFDRWLYNIIICGVFFLFHFFVLFKHS